MPTWLQISWTTPPKHPYIPYGYQQISITKNNLVITQNPPKLKTKNQRKNETPKTIPFLSDTLFPHIFLHHILPLAHLPHQTDPWKTTSPLAQVARCPLMISYKTQPKPQTSPIRLSFFDQKLQRRVGFGESVRMWEMMVQGDS